MPPWWVIVLAAYGAMSVVTLVTFAWDKRAAVRGKPRVPERVLHMLELMCGWPGAVVAMFWLRHKNRKPAYWAVTALIVVAHAGAWAALWWATRANAS